MSIFAVVDSQVEMLWLSKLMFGAFALGADKKPDKKVINGVNIR